MQTRRPGWRWKQATGIIGVLIVLVVLLWPRQPLLLSNATLITHGHSQQHNPIATYTWLSDHEAILVDSDAKPTSRFLHLDLGKQTETVIPRWTSPPIDFGFFDLQVSPDRQWIFWVEHGFETSRLYGGHLDGTHRFTHQSVDLGAGQAFWLSDSVHWLWFRYPTLLGGINVCQYSIRHPKAHPTLVPLSSGSQRDGIAVFDLVSDHRAFGCERFDTDEIKKDVKVVEMSLNTPHLSSRMWRLTAPPNTKIEELEFSPQGDRVAWLVEQEYRSTFATFLSRWFPYFVAAQRAAVQRTRSIWVCRTDGTQMREIGSVPLAVASMPENDDVIYYSPHALRWLPDGHRLSFIYKGALYTVPAD